MICPIKRAFPAGPAAGILCDGRTCAWWIEGEKRPGGCSIPRLTHYLAALLETERELLKIRRESHAWHKEDRKAFPIGGET